MMQDKVSDHLRPCEPLLDIYRTLIQVGSGRR